MDDQGISETNEIDTGVDLREYFALFWHWAWLLVLIALVAAAAAYFGSLHIQPVYQATTQMLINEAPASVKVDYTSAISGDRLASTFSELIKTDPVLQEVIKREGLNFSVEKLKENITVTIIKGTSLLEIQVEDTDPARAATIANSIVDVFSSQIQDQQSSRFVESKKSLETQMADIDAKIQAQTAKLAEPRMSDPANQAEKDRIETAQTQYQQTYSSLLQSYEQIRLAETQSTSKLIQVEAAQIPIKPVRPNVLRNTLLSAVVGLMFAIGIVLLVEMMDDTLRNPEQITKKLGLPILGVIAHMDKDHEIIVRDEPRSPISEAFRSLRTNIQYSGVDKPIRVLLITSSTPQEGKSTVSANLAAAMANSGKKVALVDADMRRPMIQKVFGLSNHKGLSDLFLLPHGLPDSQLQNTDIVNLQVITSGSIPPNPSELLGSERMREIVTSLLQDLDLVILDCPPVLAVTDAVVLASLADAMIMVAKPGITHIPALTQAVELVQRARAHLIGLVFNDLQVKNNHYKSYYYDRYYSSYNSYYYTEEGKKVHKRKSPHSEKSTAINETAGS